MAVSNKYTLPEGYIFHSSSPSLSDYLALRASSPESLTQIPPHLAQRALTCNYYAISITHSSNPDQAVSMGRVVDGGWAFGIYDIITLPEHRGRGLARFVVGEMLRKIKEDLAAWDDAAGVSGEGKEAERGKGVHITLFGAPAARKLYGEFGFYDTMPANMGMGMWMNAS